MRPTTARLRPFSPTKYSGPRYRAFVLIGFLAWFLAATSGCEPKKRLLVAPSGAGNTAAPEEINPQAGMEAAVGPIDQAVGPTPARYKPLEGPLDQGSIQKYVAAHQASKGATAAEYRYTFIPATHLGPERINYARVAISKALNSVALNAADIVNPEDASEGRGVVFAFHLPSYFGGSWQEKWGYVRQPRLKPVIVSPAPMLDLAPFDDRAPVVADRLVYNLLHGSVYNYLVEAPLLRNMMVSRIGVSEPNAHIGVQKPITYGPRYISRRSLTGWRGSYWETQDDFLGIRQPMPWLSGSIPQFRPDGMIVDFQLAVAEAWFHMRNGLPAFYVWGQGSQERTMAELTFVKDPLNKKSHDVITGFCNFCHRLGVQAIPNDMADAVEQGRVPGGDARAFWTPKAQLDSMYREDRAIIQGAMEKIVRGISGGDTDWNQALITGAEGKEPMYDLVGHFLGAAN